MIIRKISHLSGGANNVSRPELLNVEGGELADSLNYEMTVDNKLTIRKDQETYSTTLNTAIAAAYTDFQSSLGKVLYISDPWYPPVKPDDMINDFMLLTYGVYYSASPSPLYALHLFYQKTGGTWTKDDGVDDHTKGLTDAGLSFGSTNIVRFVNGENQVVITDGVNRAYYVGITFDKEFVSGTLGIPAPTNKATMAEYTAWDQSFWEETDGNDFLTLPGLVQVVYTVVDEDGEESNPSPVSLTLDMQYFRKDTDQNTDRWLQKVVINNLSVPDVIGEAKDKLKYFYVYVRTLPYVLNDAPLPFYFSQRFEIIDKTTSGSTSNSYVITVSPDGITQPSYENDVAPVAKESGVTAGITLLGNLETELKFPYVFKYYHKIVVNNLNSVSVTDALVRIKILESDIDNLTVADYASGTNPATGVFENQELIRIFDSDLTTPIPGVLKTWYTLSGAYFDIIVSIPLMLSGSNTLYLAWTPYADRVAYPGAPSDYQSFVYGQWHDPVGTSPDTWANQEVFNAGRVVDINSKVCITCDFVAQLNTDLLQNKADDAVQGEFTNGASTFLTSPIAMTTLFTSAETVGEHSLQLNPGISAVLDFDYTDNLVKIHTPDREDHVFTKWFRFEYDANPFSGTPEPIYTEEKSASFYTVLQAYDSGAGVWKLQVYSTWDAGFSAETKPFTGITLATGAGTHRYLIGLSYKIETNGDRYYSCFLLNMTTGGAVVSQELTSSDLASPGFGMNVTDGTVWNKYNNIKYGTNSDNTSALFRIDNIQRMDGLYTAGNTAAGDSFIEQVANFFPPLETLIGWDWEAGTPNNNITFPGDTEEIVTKDKPKRFQWSNLNSRSFPDLNYKDIKEPFLKAIPAPSFLQFEYGNTFIIFTRNFIYRFVLEGSPDGWRASSSSLIEEHKQFGLFASMSLTIAGQSLFWLSEVGVIEWSADSIKNISEGIIAIDKDTQFTIVYNPVRNQIILHDIDNGTGTAISYVFDLRTRGWYRFDNMDILYGTVLSEGDDTNNFCLMLKDDDKEIDKYPGATTTTETATIRTPTFDPTDGYMRRLMIKSTGGGTVAIVEGDRTENMVLPTDLDVADTWVGTNTTNANSFLAYITTTKSVLLANKTLTLLE